MKFQRQHPAAKAETVRRPRLVVLGDRGQSVELRRSTIIGRGGDCDLRLDDPGVGDRHAEIYQVGSLWWLRDLGTEGGTFLDGEIIDAAPLGTCSEIRLGAGGPALRLVGPRADSRRGAARDVAGDPPGVKWPGSAPGRPAPPARTITAA